MCLACVSLITKKIKDSNASASHTPISSVNLGIFAVRLNKIHFLFLCIVHRHLSPNRRIDERILFGKSLYK